MSPARFLPLLVLALCASAHAAAPSYGRLPLLFEQNAGQTTPDTRFLAHGPGYSLRLAPTQATMTFARKHKTAQTVQLSLVGANASASITGQNKQACVVNYFRGSDPAKWRTGIKTYGQVRAANVYRGINVLYYGNGRQLEYDWQVAPHADPSRIAWQVSGAKAQIDSKGNLNLTTASRVLCWQKPIAYQTVQGRNKPVACHYALNGDTVTLRLGQYDKRTALTVDPALVYSTYLGGEGNDFAQALAVDIQGRAVVVGHTESTDFPVTDGTGANGGTDLFIAKLNAAGTSLVFATYLGGSGNDAGSETNVGPGLALDKNANIYLSDATTSADFPTTLGAYDRTYNGGSNGDAFVTKMAADGSHLVYSRYIGGTGSDGATSIALDTNGCAYITGSTDAAGGAEGYPTTAGAYQTSGNNTVVVTKLAADGSHLIYSTCIGSGAAGYGIALDSHNNAYVTGPASAGFPITSGAYQSTYDGSSTGGFVSELNANGSALLYSTYLPGNGDNSIAVDSLGCAYITGDESGSFPSATPGAFSTTNSGRYDLYVTKLNATGTDALYSTLLGGSDYEFAFNSRILVDTLGRAYVIGLTQSSDYPVTLDAPFRTYGGLGDAVLTVLNPTGTGLVFSTYIGDAGTDVPHGLARDAQGNLYVAGYTKSSRFPTTSGTFDRTFNTSKNPDAFLVKLPPPSSAPYTSELVPNSVYSGGDAFPLTVKGGNFKAGAVVRVDGTALTTSFVSDTTLTATVPASFRQSPGSISVTVNNNDGTHTSNSRVLPVKVRLDRLSISSSAVTGGANVTGTLSLNGPAPSGGMTITLQSGSPAAVVLPQSVTIAAGKTSAKFSITTRAVNSQQSVLLTGDGGARQFATLTVLP